MAAVQRNPRKFVHFTNIAKLGINPQKRHGDPYGVYFYPARWLIAKTDDINWDSQYAVTNKYYFVCDIKKSPNSVNLGTMTLEDAKAIAERNGWLADFETVLADPTKINAGPMGKKALKLPGGQFYAAMDYLVNIFKKYYSWPRLLRGVDALIDPGKGIINKAEPAQVIVMNPSLIKIIESGSNEPRYRSLAAKAVANAAQKLGGTMFWRNGFPGIKLTVGNAPMEVLYGPLNVRHGMPDNDHGTVTVSFFHKGAWVSKWHDHHPGGYGIDEIERLIVGAVRSDAKLAEPSGVVPAWTRDHVRRFMEAFFTQRTFAASADAVGEGRVTYTIRPDLTRLAPFFLTITVEPSGAVRIDVKALIVLSYKTLDSFEKTYEFPTTPNPEQTAQKILSDFRALLRTSHLFDRRGPDDDIEKRFGILVKASGTRM